VRVIVIYADFMEAPMEAAVEALDIRRKFCGELIHPGEAIVMPMRHVKAENLSRHVVGSRHTSDTPFSGDAHVFS